jgi:hypothetical protein
VNRGDVYEIDAPGPGRRPGVILPCAGSTERRASPWLALN